jgi:tetratricopeptide (TPR) repeat protein
MRTITTLKIILAALALLAAVEVTAQESEKELAEKQQRAAEKIFDEAAKRNYRDGALDFLALIDAYPDFVKFDQAANLLAGALYELEYFEAAEQVYRHLLKSALKSPLVPDAILGLQKIAYHKGEYQQSLKFYTALESHYASNSIIDEARYYAIQANYQLGNHTFVFNTIKHIHRGSDVHPFALYTAALSDLKKKMFAAPFPALLRSAKLPPKLASSGRWSTQRG